MTTVAADRPHASTPSPSLAERLEVVPLNAIYPSRTNPRRHFDPARLADLAASIAEKGIIQPLVVREKACADGDYEIVAGECRFRAAAAAGCTHVPCIVRAYTDEQVLEVQLIENIQRSDLTALEQARGYRALIDGSHGRHTAASIATRVGMSEAWVWDRLKLNDLIPEAMFLLEREKMSTGHAILIARQKPENQKRLIDPHKEALFVPLEHGLEFDGHGDPKEKPGKYDDVKPVSVRELEAWIARHIRFDVEHAAKAVPLQFGETAQQVQSAAATPGRGKKVIAITFDHMPADDAKDPNERTYGIRSWRRADGTKKTTNTGYPSHRLVDSPLCDHSVLGVVTVGDEHYGETFQVCVARDRCRVHWGKEIAEREKNQKLREKGQTTKASRNEAAEEKRLAHAEAARRAREDRFHAFKPALQKATLAAAEKLKTPSRLQFTALVRALRLPPATTPATLAKMLLIDAIKETFQHAWFNDEPRMVAWAKLLGVNVKACEPTSAKKETAA